MKKVKFFLRVAVKLLLLFSVPVLFISAAMIEADSPGALTVAAIGAMMAVPEFIITKLEETKDGKNQQRG